MAFRNDAEFQDDFRKVGQDVTADFERPGSPSDPTAYASSENLDVAGKADDLEDDDDEDEFEDDDDLEDEDDDDEEEEDDDLDDEEDDLDEEEDEDDDEDELEDDDDAVKARLAGAETQARAR
jgi:hypothetical protein